MSPTQILIKLDRRERGEHVWALLSIQLINTGVLIFAKSCTVANCENTRSTMRIHTCCLRGESDLRQLRSFRTFRILSSCIRQDCLVFPIARVLRANRHCLGDVAEPDLLVGLISPPFENAREILRLAVFETLQICQFHQYFNQTTNRWSDQQAQPPVIPIFRYHCFLAPVSSPLFRRFRLSCHPRVNSVMLGWRKSTTCIRPCRSCR